MEINELNAMHGFTIDDVEETLWTTPNMNADVLGSKLREPVRLFLYRNKDFFKRNNDINPLWSCMRPPNSRKTSGNSTQSKDDKFKHSQISEDATFADVDKYAPFAKSHSKELREFLKANIKSIPRDLHIIDIGCGYGYGMSDFEHAKFTVLSYQGTDHNPQMRTKATERIGSLDIHTDLTALNQIKGECLVLINHVFGQETVNNETVTKWSNDLKRICLSGFVLLSIEPSYFEPSIKYRSAFIKNLNGIGFKNKEIDVVSINNFKNKDISLQTFSLK